MQSITVTPSSVLAFILATSQHKPKGNSEFYDALQITKSLKPLFEEKTIGDRVSLVPTFPANEVRTITLESSAFRLLKSAFESARDGGAVYSFSHAEMVCSAEEALKNSTNGVPDPVK